MFPCFHVSMFSMWLTIYQGRINQIAISQFQTMVSWLQTLKIKRSINTWFATMLSSILIISLTITFSASNRRFDKTRVNHSKIKGEEWVEENDIPFPPKLFTRRLLPWQGPGGGHVHVVGWREGLKATCWPSSKWYWQLCGVINWRALISINYRDERRGLPLYSLRQFLSRRVICEETFINVQNSAK